MATAEQSPNQDRASRPSAIQEEATQEEFDPVCGMKVEGASPDLAVKFEGKTYRFCSKLCQDTFRSDPEQFTSEA